MVGWLGSGAADALHAAVTRAYLSLTHTAHLQAAGPRRSWTVSSAS